MSKFFSITIKNDQKWSKNFLPHKITHFEPSTKMRIFKSKSIRNTYLVFFKSSYSTLFKSVMYLNSFLYYFICLVKKNHYYCCLRDYSIFPINLKIRWSGYSKLAMTNNIFTFATFVANKYVHSPHF